MKAAIGPGEVGGPPSIDPIAEQPADPEVESLFFDEYPIAAKRLASAISRVRGEAIFRNPLEGRQNEWLHLHFLRFDDNLRVRVSRSADDPDFSDQAVLVTPARSSHVRAPLTRGAALSNLDEQPTREIDVFLNRRWRHLAEATFSVDAMNISQQLETGLWKYLSGHRDHTDPNLIVVHFSFHNPDFPGDIQPQGRISIVFDRAKDWSVRKLSLHSETFNYVLRGIVDAEKIDGLGVVPKEVHLEVFSPQTGMDGLMPLAQPVLTEVTDCRILRVDPVREIPTKEFTLASLGVEEVSPRRRYLLVAVNTVVLALLIVYLLIRRRFAKWRPDLA